ncbi:MAG: hypothetical protein MJ087_04120 [Lachnospiraceae bacterium]|nr:hypothetical protein [Lachnospiraceae bacterium]
MKSQQEFLDGLQDLIKIGKTNGNELSKKEIHDFFEDYDLTEEQMSLVGLFMQENNIKVTGVVVTPMAEQEEDPIVTKEEHSAVLEMYKEELKEIGAGQKAEEEALLRQFLEGSAEAMNRLVEMNLLEVSRLAERYAGKGVPVADLIQEGNLALFIAVTEYDASKGDFHACIMESAKAAMESYIEENNIATKMDRKISRQANQLNDIATAFAKEHDREAKPEELAELMHITVEEVKDLMKMSLDAVNVLESRNVNM